jgi:phosphoserine phosphatase RsbU/P
VRGLLFSGNAELRTSIWAALITLTALLFDIYLISLLVASFMAFGLSRAVNRLSAATERIAKGDFSVRIPVRRKDQIGALQRDFNHMTEHLEELVQTAAQKEALESELQTARRLQTSLLPHRLDVDPRVEIAAFFEPSAAIGGDYYDVVCLPGDRLAIFVADVSGHGLPAGLRMAMIKAGVNLLAGQGLEPSALLAKLDGLVRSAASGEAAGDDGGRRKRRDFVTASLALLDLASGDLELTNAGHPPLYVARAGAVVAVDEIALPGSALGGLGTNYGSERVRLTSGDCAIWLSDGLIEACNDHLEAFGYDRVRAALATGTTAGGKIAALLAAVRAHTGGREVEDDRTVVALRFL